MNNLQAIVIALSITPLFTACGGGGGGGGGNGSNAAGNEVSISANLGTVANATVNLMENDGETRLATGATGQDGEVTLDVGGYDGPVVVEVIGNGNTTYFDESTLTTAAFSSNDSMFALLPSVGDATVAVTPLTDIAYRRARSLNLFPVTSEEVTNLNGAVRSSLAPGLVSILSVPTLFDENTTTGSLDDTEAGRYALVLAGMADVGAGSATPALAILNAIRVDVRDGLIDSADNGRNLTTAPPYSDFLSELRTSIRNAASRFGNSDLQGRLTILLPVDIDITININVDNGQDNGSDDSGNDSGGDNTSGGGGNTGDDGSPGDGSGGNTGSDGSTGDDTSGTDETGGSGGTGGTGGTGTGGGGF